MQAIKVVSRIVAAVFLCATVLMTEAGFSQDLILNNDINNAGTINVGRHVINNKSSGNAMVSVTGTGVVRLRGTGAGSHEIKSNGTAGISFSNLDLIDSRPTTLMIATTVADRLRVGDGTTAYTAAGNGFDIGSQTLTIGNLSSYMSTSTAQLTFSSGTVNYTNATSQTILTRGSAGLPTTYGTLALSGNAAFTIPAGSSTGIGIVNAATVSHTGSGTVTVNDTMNVTVSGSFGTIADVASGNILQFSSTTSSSSITTLSTLNGRIQKSGDQSLTITTVTTTATSGVIENAGTGTLTIGTLTDNAGTIQSTSTGTVAFTNAATSSGTITTATGTLDFNGDLNGTGTISLTGAGFVEFGGSVTQNTYNLNNGTVIYNSSTAGQSVVSTTYNNLSLANASKTLAGAVTVNGNLTLDASSPLNAQNNNITLAGNLDLGSNVSMGSGVLTMTSTTAANVTGAGYVTGAVRRSHDFAAGQNYRFNSANIYLATTAQAGTDLTLKLTLATPPGGTLPTTKYVNRRYEITPTNAGSLTAAQLVYDDGELVNISNESRIGIRLTADNGTSWAKVGIGTQRSVSTATNLVTISGVNQSLVGADEFGLYQVTLISAATGNWATASTWDEGVTPTNDDDVEVATAVTVAADVTGTDRPASVLVKTGGSLNLSTGSLAILGTLDVTNDGSITSSSGRTLSGTSWTNNTSGSSTFNGDVNFTSLTNTAGTLTFNGSASSITGAVSNAAAGIINVGGTLSIATASASTVSSDGNISVTGTGILNVGASGVLSNLSMTGTSTLSVDTGANLNVFGNLELGSTVTLTNNGTITVGE